MLPDGQPFLMARALSIIPGSLISQGRWVAVTVVLSVGSLLALIACLGFGAEDISFARTAGLLWQVVRNGNVDPAGMDTQSTILVHVRLPRVLLSFMVGGTLAAVGVALQALLRNPLADPYVLGVSSGAAFGVALALLFGLGTTLLAISTLPLFAFAGGLGALIILYRIAVVYGRLPVHTLLLAGVILNAVFSALIMFATSLMDPARSLGMLSWMMGALSSPRYGALFILAGYLAFGGVLLVRHTHHLNLLTLGEDTARTLGIEVERTKKTIFLVSALLTGAVVSMSGMIGFIGMLVPHAVRMVLGADHRLLLTSSILVGGVFLMIADTLARTAFAPDELPVGVVTALLGGPCFLYLLMKRRGGLVL